MPLGGWLQLVQVWWDHGWGERWVRLWRSSGQIIQGFGFLGKRFGFVLTGIHWSDWIQLWCNPRYHYEISGLYGLLPLILRDSPLPSSWHSVSFSSFCLSFFPFTQIKFQPNINLYSVHSPTWAFIHAIISISRKLTPFKAQLTCHPLMVPFFHSFPSPNWSPFSTNPLYLMNTIIFH